MAEDILGITGQFDISDIQKSINELDRLLGIIDNDVTETGKNMDKSFASIDLSKVQQQINATEKELESIANVIKANTKEINDFQIKISDAQKAISQGGNASALNAQIKEYEETIKGIQQNSKELITEHDQLQGSLTTLVSKYNMVSEAANAMQTTSNAMTGASAIAHAATATAVGAETVSHSENANVISVETEKTQENIQSKKELQAELKLLQDGLTYINAELEKYGNNTAIQKQEERVNNTREAIEKFKQQLADGTADAGTLGAQQYGERLQQIYDEANAKLEAMKAHVETLKHDQAEYTNEISKTEQKINDCGTAHTKSAGGAKNVKEEVKNIGNEADKTAKKIGGIFGNIKTAGAKALSGNFSGLFGLIGKIGAWGAAIAAIGKGLYELTVRAEEFRNALQPLKHYMDGDSLKAARQDILALSSTTTKSVADMAEAATVYVKVWTDMSKSPDTLIKMVKSSNEFAALSGRTSKESAKYLSELASEYHMTAKESRESSAIIATAAHNSTSSFSEMADAVKNAGTTASMYGISMKDMASLIGFSSNQFGGAEKAASKFSMLLMNMTRLQKDYNPSMVGMTTALQNLKKAYDRGEPVEKQFMARQRAVAMYFIKNADSIAEYSKNIDSNKAKQELLNDANYRASVNVGKLQNAWEGFLTSMNANLTPVLTDILKFFTKIIGGAQDTADKLNYIKNYGRLHPEVTKQPKTSSKLPYFVDQTDVGVIARGERENIKTQQEADYKKYQKQESSLIYQYEKAISQAKTKVPNASQNAILNMAGNAMVRFYEKNRGNGRYSEFDPQMFNAWLRKQRNSREVDITKPDRSQLDLTGLDGSTDKKNKDNERKNAQKKNADDLLKLQQQNADDEVALMKENTEKKLAEIKNDYEKRRAEIDKQEKEFKENNKKAGTKTNADGLTTKQTDALDTARKNNDKKYNKEISEARKEELQSMRDYLKKHGSFYQQRIAIEEDYNEKIKKAATEGERLSLEAEKKETLANFNYQAISQGIDWKALLGGVNNLSKEMLKPMFDQLEAYTKTEEFKQAGTESQQKVVELMQEIRSYLGTDQNATWTSLAEAIDKFNLSVSDYKSAVDSEKKANATLQTAKEDLKSGKITKEVFENIKKKSDEASQAVVDAKNKMNTFGVQLNSTTDAVKNYTSGLTAALNKLDAWKGVDGYSNVKSAIGNIDALKGALDSSLSTMQDGTTKTIGVQISSSLGKTFGAVGDGITKTMGSAIGSIVGVVAQIPKLILSLADSIKNFVTGILDSLTELLKFKWLSDLVNSVLDSVGNLIDAIFDLPENLFKVLESIVVKGVGGLVNSVVGRIGNVLSLGAISSKGPASWFTNSNGKEVAETTEKLTDSNERLTKSVDNLKDELSKQSGFKAISTATKAYEDQKKINEQTKKILDTQMNYHGSHHSNAWYWDWSEEYQKRTNALLADYKAKNSDAETKIDRVGKGASSLYDFYNLTPEQLDYIRTYDVELWYDLTHQGKYDKSEYWENVADNAGKTEEILESLRETLTQTSFDSLRSSFVDSLMDMSKSAQDFSDDFSKMLMQSVLNAQISDLLDDDMEAFYKKWAEYAKSGGVLDENEIKELQEDYKNLTDRGLEIRDQAAQITGYDSTSASQKSGSNSASSMTNDQANELNGRFTALQIVNEQQNQNLIKQIDLQVENNDILSMIEIDISAINMQTKEISNNMSEMLDIQYDAVDRLGKIAQYTSCLPAMNEQIGDIYRSVKDINRK